MNGYRMDTTPYDGVKRSARREMRDEIAQLLAQILAVTEKAESRDVLWDAIEQVRGLE